MIHAWIRCRIAAINSGNIPAGVWRSEQKSRPCNASGMSMFLTLIRQIIGGKFYYSKLNSDVPLVNHGIRV